MSGTARLAVDIGGTFTDLALQDGDRSVAAKVLTTPDAPERGVLEGIDLILGRAGLDPRDLAIIIHGTTLATNAIIERKGTRTAMLVTEGFRDSIAMAYENRFEQYDLMMERPAPLVPRELRLPVPERMDARGNVVVPLDEAALAGIAGTLKAEQVGGVAICFLHSYANAAHEERAREVLQAALPGMAITLSSEVCPEIREYERWSTASANAYIQPVMASYLKRLVDEIRARDIACPFYMITSAGGLTEVETARRFPIRLVESGPAGGAILAAHVARQCGYGRIMSFDMGGTTAKICLIDGGEPHYSRNFEVAREYRFLKGSGLPIRIPVIDMVEIGAGGGSVASIDELSRIQIGPQSMGSQPGPACYGRGGTAATVTDADVVLGRIDPEHFAGGSFTLHGDRAADAVAAAIGAPLDLPQVEAALGISEVVEENMANAARVHAIELGSALGERTMVAFGGAAPLHAVRLAEKLSIDRIVVPRGAGVGSAVGFLIAPVAYEIARSRFMPIDAGFDAAAMNALRAEMYQAAEAVVRAGAPDAPLVATWTADMRYAGQGHEIVVPLPAEPFAAGDEARLAALFVARYEEQFGRSIPNLAVEAIGWSLRLATEVPPPEPCPPTVPAPAPAPVRTAKLVDPASAERGEVPVYLRESLSLGASVAGPCLIVEDETTTVVGPRFTATINGLGHIVLERGAKA
ncbi:hydantoinase/oxoprolinase family protein [Marinibaculum pumilum]|uniref:Hydantoinase/oxoprolinase family protein n=1 Tax=Marinibaculum pumilum TaxID=1766165 RepID=A0ABV7KZQ1_9PROT